MQMENILETMRAEDFNPKLSPEVTDRLKCELLRMSAAAPEHVRRVIRDTIRRHVELFVEGEV